MNLVKPMQKAPINSATLAATPLMSAEIRHQIAQRSAHLSAIAAELKNELFGIDAVIDRVMESVRAWYVLPQIIQRPVIVCLWGLTGTGKTQLTRSLAQKLGFYSKFVEVQMDGFTNDSGRRSQTISGMLAESITEGEPGILVLDEFQRFRTLDSQGKDIKVERYMDVWTLLSDGRLPPSLAFMSEMQMALASAYYKQDLRGSDGEEGGDSVLDDQALQGSSVEVQTLFETTRAAPKGRHRFRLSPYDANEFKNVLKLKEPLTTIMAWSFEEVLSRMEAFCENPAVWETDYSRLLIFVCGNLDEMYAEVAHRVEDCDTDADIFNALTQRLSIIDVKRALSQRFKPEQIARLGNCHILYPSFSRATFEKLIVEHTQKYLQDVQTTSGLCFVLSEELLHQIYINGVFPSQGTRPLFSTIHGILSGALVHFTLWALEHLSDASALATEAIVVDVDPTRQNLVAHWRGLRCTAPVGLEIHGLRQRSDENFKALLAVHEAGHGLLYALLFGQAPQEIKINVASYSGGYNTYIHLKAYSRRNILDTLCVALGGRAAEAWVFGEDSITSGCSNDLKHATQRAAEFVRYFGFSDRLSRTDRVSDEDNSVNIDMEPSNRAIEALLQEQSSRAQTLLRSHRALFMRIAQALFEEGEVLPTTLAAWMGIEIASPRVVLEPFSARLQAFEEVTVSANDAEALNFRRGA